MGFCSAAIFLSICHVAIIKVHDGIRLRGKPGVLYVEWE